MFTEEQFNRYSRNILIKEIGIEGQEKLARAKVLVIGGGGLGSPVLMYLTVAGIGAIGIVDFDSVDVSNLQRQILHFTSDIGKEKTLSATEKLSQLNPHTKFTLYKEKLTAQNIISIINNYDFIVDCTDNFETKFLINDTCVQQKKPFSHAGVLRFEGQVMTHVPSSACLRCMFDTIPSDTISPKSSTHGILGATAGIAGTMQASEVIKFFTQSGELLTNRMLFFDALNMKFREVKFEKNDECEICNLQKH